MTIAKYRDGEHGPPAVVVQDLEVGIEVDCVEAWDGDRVALPRGPADQSAIQLDPGGA